MLGHLESYDERCQTGVVKHDGKFYEFHLDQWTSQQPPKEGDDVDFVEENGEITEIGPVGAYLVDSQPVKSRIVAALLGVVLGAIGLHRMYLGFWGLGITQIIVTFITGGFGVVWGFIEGVLIFTGHINKDAKGRFLK
ncbi:TM2 domain-containing protein [Methylomonas rapida]|jgi:Predicted membrane protein|uniref:TM2 domain-containing protein n=1 Tax=Methylomonas rapida TaxID=2963939 RepID=A0ABY7GKR4_9GAMM|nr:TM2 domain-containing protein [Methylomonas rapida]WAR45084.1 TM2 domain-containing protein [Methylomonas rapida]